MHKRSKPDMDGGSTVALVARAAALRQSAMRAKGGADPTAAKPSAGDTTSPRSHSPNTNAGKQDAQQPAAPQWVQLPSPLIGLRVLLYDLEAIHQMWAFDGGGRLIVGDSDAEIPPGRWALVQLKDEGEPLPADTLYRVPRYDP